MTNEDFQLITRDEGFYSVIESKNQEINNSKGEHEKCV